MIFRHTIIAGAAKKTKTQFLVKVTNRSWFLDQELRVVVLSIAHFTNYKLICEVDMWLVNSYWIVTSKVQ